MEKNNYSTGDIIIIEEKLAYLQYKSNENKYGATFSKKETPLNLIGSLNKYCLGDGIIKDITKYPKLNKKEHLRNFGLSIQDKNNFKKRSNFLEWLGFNLN